MAKINDTTQAFVVKIQSLYDIEKQLQKALPLMAEASTSEELREGFINHLEETNMHVERLERIFDLLEQKPDTVKCEGVRGIIEDGSWVMGVDAPAAIKDAMIASAARYAEHYEMAGYLSAVQEANLLDFADIEDLLSESLAEEQAADEILATVSKKLLTGM